MISFRGIYKPFDFLIYKTIRLWKLMGVFDEDNYHYFQLSGFISSFQLFSLLAIIEWLSGAKSGNLIVFLVAAAAFLGLIFFNFFRYKNYKLNDLVNYWDNETKSTKQLLELILTLYFCLALICIFMLVSNK